MLVIIISSIILLTFPHLTFQFNDPQLLCGSLTNVREQSSFEANTSILTLSLLEYFVPIQANFLSIQSDNADSVSRTQSQLISQSSTVHPVLNVLCNSNSDNVVIVVQILLNQLVMSQIMLASIISKVNGLLHHETRSIDMIPVPIDSKRLLHPFDTNVLLIGLKNKLLNDY